MLIPSKTVRPLDGLVSIALLGLIVSNVGVNCLHAQAASASIQGTVTDMSGAAVPDASVQVRNTGTDASQKTTTDSAGRFTVSDLPVGNYELQASTT